MKQNRSKKVAATTALVVAFWGQCAIMAVIAGDEVPAAGGGEDSPSSAEQLYTLEGSDASLADLLVSGAIVPGQRFGNGPVHGARVVVNHERLEQLTGKPRATRSNSAGACIWDRKRAHLSVKTPCILSPAPPSGEYLIAVF